MIISPIHVELAIFYLVDRPGVRRQTQDAVHRDLGQTRDKRGGAVLRFGQVHVNAKAEEYSLQW